MPYRVVTPTPPAPRHASEVGLLLLGAAFLAASPILFPAWVLYDAWLRFRVSLLPLPGPSIEPLLARLAVERPISTARYVWVSSTIASGPEEDRHVVVVRFGPGRRGDRIVVGGDLHTQTMDPGSVVLRRLFQMNVERVERKIGFSELGCLFAVPATFAATGVLAAALGKPVLWLLALLPGSLALSSIASRCERRWWKRGDR